jgi:hypothetical protein
VTTHGRATSVGAIGTSRTNSNESHYLER